jgi:hypothetical protein
MRHVITVTPVEAEWAVLRDGAEPWVFKSGAQAEWAARRLGDVLAGDGEAVEVRIMLRGGGCAGRFIWDPTYAAADRRVVRELATA